MIFCVMMKTKKDNRYPVIYGTFVGDQIRRSLTCLYSSPGTAQKCLKITAMECISPDFNVKHGVKY